MDDDKLRVTLALVQDVYEEMKAKFDDFVAFKTPGDLSATTGHTHWEVRELLKQLDGPETRLADHPDKLAFVAFLRGRLNGLRFNCGAAVAAYEEALSLDDSPKFQAMVRYYLGCTHQVWGKRTIAIEELTRVTEVVGTNEEMGLDAAKRVERMQEQKGGCFVVTAVCGREDAPEVVTLRLFRERVLSRSIVGRAAIGLYARLGPSIARRIEGSSVLRRFFYWVLVWPLAKLCQLWERKES